MAVTWLSWVWHLLDEHLSCSNYASKSMHSVRFLGFASFTFFYHLLCIFWLAVEGINVSTWNEKENKRKKEKNVDGSDKTVSITPKTLETHAVVCLTADDQFPDWKTKMNMEKNVIQFATCHLPLWTCKRLRAFYMEMKQITYQWMYKFVWSADEGFIKNNLPCCGCVVDNASRPE